MDVLNDYVNSIYGRTPINNKCNKSFYFIIEAVFAGYIITAAHPKFLKMFEHPLIQFLIFYIIGITWHTGEVPPGGWGGYGFKTLWAGPYVFLDAIFSVILIRSIVYLSHKYYGK